MLARLCATTGPLAIVDLETTGLPHDPQAELLEFGAVQVAADGVVTLSTLLRPSHPLPRAIRRLTGLDDGDVADAPTLSDARAAIAEALAGRVIVAHNADFERHFLSRAVDPALDAASFLDTQDLLALTHPDASDLRLETFTRTLLEREEKHRALDDALDTLRVMSAAGAGADAGEPRYAAARAALATYTPESPWLSLLGKDGASRPAPRRQYVEVGDTPEAPVPFDEEAILGVLADGERCRRHIPGYRTREAQLELARRFVRTLAGGGVSLLEGGTGVGKSLAYLAAAIPFVAAGGGPVVVSTRTKLLQDQLVEKDIAAAARLFGYSGLRAMSIKGRANYVCERRLEAVLAEGHEPSIFPEDRWSWAVLSACARTRPYGELGSLPPVLLRRYPTLLSLRHRAVSARAEQCSREQCATWPTCPFGRRRAALSEAELVVTNHDLLLRWPPDFPSFRHAIVDEAHELADVADEVYAVEVRPEEILDRIDEVFGRPQIGVAGAKSSARDALLSAGTRRRLEKDARAWRRGVQQDLVALGRQLDPLASDFGEVHVPDPPGPRYADAAWQAEAAGDRLDRVADEIDDLADEESGERTPVIARVAADLRRAAGALRAALTGSGADAVAAFERVEAPWDRWRLVVRPVAPAASFHEGLLERLDSFAAVSASLFVAGDAFAALGTLEVEERSADVLDRLSVPSPFPYSEHMRVVAFESNGNLVGETADVLADLARRLGGRTLGLFTSLRRMRDVAEVLSERLEGEGIEVLVPRGAADDPAALVERFRQSDAAVLLGARAFWQGLDIPGIDLQALVIEKLPFEVPTELRRRREARLRELGIDPFSRDALGRMLLYLKQMVGRLIRSEDDRGVVVIVEGRTDKRYFARLGDALPPGVEVRVVRPEEIAGVLAEVGLPEDP